VLAGDSAGGNMCLAVLSHLSHPQPSVPPLDLSEPLFGAALISPWVTFSQSSSSFTSNLYKDMLPPEALKTWSDAFQGSAPADPFNQPLTAPAGWWKDLKVSEILLTGGSDELFVDDIKEFGEILVQEFAGKLTTIISPKCAHDQPLLDGILGAKEPGEQVQAFISWIGARS
jgi:acetyl esterase/lipase